MENEPNNSHIHGEYRRFRVGPTLNNFFFKLYFFGDYHIVLLKSFEIKV